MPYQIFHEDTISKHRFKMNHFFQTDISFEPYSIITIKDTSRKEESPDELQQIFNKTFNEQEDELVGFVDDGEVHRPELEFNRFFAWHGPGLIKSSKLASEPKLEDIQPLRQVTVQCELNKPTKRVHSTTVAADDSDAKSKKKKKEMPEIVDTPTGSNMPNLKVPKKKDKKKLSKFIDSLKEDAPSEKTDTEILKSSGDNVPNKSQVPTKAKHTEVPKPVATPPHAKKPMPVILFGDLKSGMSHKSSANSRITTKPSKDVQPNSNQESPNAKSPQKKKDKVDDLFPVHGLLTQFDANFKDLKKITPDMSKAIDMILLHLLDTIHELPFIIFERLSHNCGVTPAEFKSFIQSNSLAKLIPKVDGELAKITQHFNQLASSINFTAKIKLAGSLRNLAKALTQAHMAHLYVHGHLDCGQGVKGVLDKKIRMDACEKVASMFQNAVDVKRFQKLLQEEKRKMRSGGEDSKSLIMTKTPASSPKKDPTVKSYEKELEGLFNQSGSVPDVSPTAINDLPYPQVASTLKEAAKMAQIAKMPKMEKLKFGNSNTLPPLNISIKPNPSLKPTTNKPSPLKVMPPYAKYAIESKSAKTPKKDDDVINLLSD